MNNKDRRHHELMAKLEEIVRLLQLTRAPLNRQEQPFSLQKQYTQTPLSPPLGQKIPLEPHEHLSRSPVTEHPAEPKAAE